jgi:tRNA(Arg) A34 adenosine deaminase TadA
MEEAIQLSREMMRGGAGGPFGAIVVRRGEILARGWNAVTSTNDPTAHAEVMAIRQASQRLGTFRLDDCELYSSCEPCPMCLAAAYWARLSKVCFAATRDDASAVGFDDRWLYEEFQRPRVERVLPLQQCLREKALLVLEEWKAKTDKTPY